MKTATELLIDVLKEDDLWSSFADVAQRVYDAKVDAPLSELERIRHLDQDTDQTFVERSIRQAGLALTSEFFELNKDKISNSFYELIKFWEVDGTPNYPKFIAFVLGRNFTEQVLYTNDYVDFTTEHGKLITEGGDWYSTSHVDLSIDAKGLKESLTLRITSEDIPSLRKALGYSRADSEGKASIDNLITSMSNRELNPLTDDARVVKTLIQNRILSVYYQFAPIEKVVREIYLSMEITKNLFISGSTLFRRKVYAKPGAPLPVHYASTIPTKVEGLRDYSPTLLVTYQDGTQMQRLPTNIHGEHVELFEANILRLSDVDFVTETDIVFTIDGIDVVKTVDLYPIGTGFVPDEVSITGPVNPLEGGDNTYTLITKTDNVRRAADPDRVTWSIDSDVASFTDNVLVIDEIFDAVNATITATHSNSDGTQSISTLSVVLVPMERNLMPKRIDIKVEQQINGVWTELDPGADVVQGMTGVYLTPVVVYTDDSEVELSSVPAQLRAGSEELTIPQWNVSTNATSIDSNGQIDIPIVYRDFSANFVSTYQEGDRTVTGSITILFKKPRLVVESIQIIGLSTVTEETRSVYQVQATWSNGQTSIVEADWSSSRTAGARSANISDNGILSAPSVDKDSVNVNINASISVYRYDANDEESIVRLSTSKVVAVNALRREIDRLEVLTPQGLSQGNTNRIRMYADWNDDTATQIIPNRIELIKNGQVISKYIRSYDIANERFEDTFEHETGNPVILTTKAGEEFEAVEDGTTHEQFYIDYLLTENENSSLVAVNGLVEVKVYYINPLDDDPVPIEMTDYWLANPSSAYTTYSTNISVVPKVFLSESLEIIYAPEMAERSRVFLTALVTYANGETEQSAAVWSVEPVYVDQEVEADLTQGTFTVERMVEVLIGLDREDLNTVTLTDAQVTKLVEGELLFATLAETAQADWTDSVRNLIDANVGKQFPRALLQTRPLEDGTVSQEFKVNARYFQQNESVTITNTADVIQPHDTINSSRIEGPGEVYADTTLYYSYGLVVDYDDLGISYMVSNGWTVDVINKAEVLTTLVNSNDNYRSLLPTKSDLSVYTVAELNEDQLTEIFQQIFIAEIDTNGYLYPRINVDAELLITATYDDEITTFEKTLEVFLKRTNSILTGMYVLNVSNDGSFERTTNVTVGDSSGANDIIRLRDVAGNNVGTPDAFDQIDATSGKLFYRFKAQVERTDDLGTFYDPEVVTWTLETASDKVSLMQPTKNIIGLMVSPVEADTQVIIRGVYTEEFERTSDSIDSSNPLAGEDRVETVSSSIRVIIESSKAIETIQRTGSTYAYDTDGTIFVPSVSILRRDGTFVSNPEALVTWYIMSGPVGLVQDEETGGFVIPKLTANTTMVLRAVAREGLQTIQSDFEYTLLMEFVPSSIELTLPQTNQDALIDSGEYSLGALLTGTTSDGTEVRAINDLAFYYFNYSEDDARFEDNVLTIDPVTEDKDITITIKAKDYPSFYDTKTIKVYSSYPLFGTYAYGVSNTSLFQSVVDEGAFTKLLSRTGGIFNVDPDADEYGYFAHPKALGLATFTYIPEPNSASSIIGGWDGAQRGQDGSGTQEGPITVTRTYESGLTEQWYLYRTNLRGFSAGRFAVSYTEE